MEFRSGPSSLFWLRSSLLVFLSFFFQLSFMCFCIFIHEIEMHSTEETEHV